MINKELFYFYRCKFSYIVNGANNQSKLCIFNKFKKKLRSWPVYINFDGAYFVLKNQRKKKRCSLLNEFSNETFLTILFLYWYTLISNHAKIHWNKLTAGCWHNSMYWLISIHFLYKRLDEWLPLVVMFILYKKLFQKIFLLLKICYYRMIKYHTF